jgi:hypothetical protein
MRGSGRISRVIVRDNFTRAEAYAADTIKVSVSALN